MRCQNHRLHENRFQMGSHASGNIIMYTSSAELNKLHPVAKNEF